VCVLVAGIFIIGVWLSASTLAMSSVARTPMPAPSRAMKRFASRLPSS
jgi:hypothetical protein